jgi:hypothetical protein
VVKVVVKVAVNLAASPVAVSPEGVNPAAVSPEVVNPVAVSPAAASLAAACRAVVRRVPVVPPAARRAAMVPAKLAVSPVVAAAMRAYRRLRVSAAAVVVARTVVLPAAVPKPADPQAVPAVAMVAVMVTATDSRAVTAAIPVRCRVASAAWARRANAWVAALRRRTPRNQPPLAPMAAAALAGVDRPRVTALRVAAALQAATEPLQVPAVLAVLASFPGRALTNGRPASARNLTSRLAVLTKF